MNDTLSLESYRRAVAHTLTRCFSPWQRMPPAVWAEEVYRLPNGGRFKWAYAPYVRQIFESYFDPKIIETNLMMYSRGLKSTTVLLAIGYTIDQSPRRILSLWPTNSQSEKYSKDVLCGELFNTTDCLSYLGERGKKRDGSNTILHKNFPGGLIDLFGANAPGDMRRAKGSFLYADEIDAIDTTETDEGDQLAIFSKRGDEYPDTIRIYASYPSLKGHSRIESKMQETDWNQWYSTCVVCGGEPFVMHRRMLKYDADNTAGARFECPRCKAMLTDSQRYEMAHKQGFNNWKPSREFRGRRGFHANAMLWPHPVDTQKFPGGFLQMMAEQEVAAERSDNPHRSRRVLVNTVDAETYDPDTKSEIPPDWMQLLQRRESYATDAEIKLPIACLYMTAGIDVQPDRLEITRTAWGRDEKSWHVDHVIVAGDIKSPETWKAFEKELLRDYKREDGAPLELSFALIDAGHGAEHLLWFFEYLRTSNSPLKGKIRACRGSSQYPHPIVDFKWARLVKQLKGHWVGGDEAKDLIYSRLKMAEDGPGYRHYGRNCNEGFFKQLCAEKLTVGFERGNETRRFKNEDHVRNEALDCAVYSFAAFRLKRPNLDILERELVAKAMQPEEKQRVEAEQPKPTPSKRGFVGFSGKWSL